MKTPQRNDICPCGSGLKFKKCCAGQTPPQGRGSEPRSAMPYFRFRVSLEHTDRPIWRSFLLRVDKTFADLHDAIQACAWTDSHLWMFMGHNARKVLAGVPDDEGWGEPTPDARRVPLAAHFMKAGDEVLYLYDFGDGWEHKVFVEGIEEHSGGFERALLDGAGDFPPEDCGGIPGFHRLLEFLETDKDPWDEAEGLAEWASSAMRPSFDLDRERAAFGWVAPSASPTGPAPSPPPASQGEPRAPVPARTQAIDKKVMELIARRMGETMSALADELGLSMRMSRASYLDINAKLEFEIATIRDDGVVMDKHAEDFLKRCGDFGLTPADLGRTFVCGEERFQIIGLKPRANQPVVCKPCVPLGEKRCVRMSSEFVRKHLDMVDPAKLSLRSLADG